MAIPTAMLKRQLILIILHLANLLSNLLGADPISLILRRALFRSLGLKIGEGSVLHGGSRILGTTLHIGQSCFVNRDCYFDLSGPITIGNNVLVGHRVTFITAKHEVGPPSRRAGTPTCLPIHVCNGAWIGANAILMPGVTIGAGAIVAAGAVVTRDVQENTLVVGSPATVLKQLPSDEF